MAGLSIRARLILLSTLQIIILMSFGGIYLDWRLRQTLEDELADKLETVARAGALQIDGELLLTLAPGDETSRTYRNLASRLQTLQTATGVRRLYVFSSEQKSLIDTNPDIRIGSDYVFMPITNDERQRLFAGKSVNSTLFAGSDGRLYKTGYAPIYADNRIIGALGVEASAQTLEAIQIVRRDILVIGLAVLLGAIVLGWLFSKTITTPIQRLKLAAEGITAGDYNRPIEVDSRNEIGFLGQTMEEMRRAITQRDIRQKAMLAGVAHEIRNPLGGIELFAGLLASELTEEKAKAEARKIQNEVQNLKKIVTDFLEYARPSKPKKENCRVREVFDEVKILLSQELNGYEIGFREEPTGQQIRVDPQHLKQILLNLMKNSIEAMPGSGRIQVEALSEKDSIRLLFSDDGPGIPTEIRDQIFEPFITGRKDGTGLGLAIVKTLVEENGGQIELAAAEGKGTKFALQFEKFRG